MGGDPALSRAALYLDMARRKSQCQLHAPWGQTLSAPVPGPGPGSAAPTSLSQASLAPERTSKDPKEKKSVSSVAQLCLTLCNPMDCSTPGFLVHHQPPELAQTHVHQVGDAIQPPHSLSSPSPPAFNLSQHQGLFQSVSLVFSKEKNKHREMLMSEEGDKNIWCR